MHDGQTASRDAGVLQRARLSQGEVRVTSGDYHFGWDIDGRQTKKRLIGGAGGPTAHACLDEVLVGIEASPAFDVSGQGRLYCSVTFRTAS